ncbi:hypothetical protein A0128_09035 [Leptospira tipperaryensis]|uniref:DUF1109 domain-containing protein n=1 Tax=Leptospira tipperaryensis TaxID=2564040 RepID=A0A1D7UWJ9_9LEPT|nr:NrsF family protein [Leptospira tipperaryensis]AOP33970.1 hypothetical protein A0128_09035 [Leptospira tipperaryensis]
MLSKEEKTESLIQKMAAEPPSKENLWGNFVMLLPIFAIVFILFLLSLNPITAPLIHIPTLFPDFLWIAIVGISSFWILSQLRFPEESFSKSSKLPILLSFIWVLYSAGLYAWDIIADHEFSHHIGRCSAIIFISSLVFCGSGLYLFRKGKPGNPVLSAAVLSVFSLALANFCLKFVCGDQSSYHILFSHGLPSVLLFLIGSLAFKNILKW